jgi:tetratricopeptide (TPR) repeat protein
MPGFPDKVYQFWRELTKRKVLRSTTVYVAVVFGLLELIDIVSGPLHLPGWILKLFIFLFIAGLPVTVLISWIFMFTPEGIKRYGKNHLDLLIERGEDGSLVAVPESESARADKLIPLDREMSGESEKAGPAKRPGMIYGFSSIAVICLVVVSFLFFSGSSTPFNDRDWVVLADFVNHTQDDIFDHSLNTAFEISIDQSRRINVVTRKRINEVLKRIGKTNETQIDESLCREIALREGARAYILPEISSVGTQYILTAKIMETESSEVVASEVLYTRSREEILDQLDHMSRKMRRDLGESRYRISGQNKPLEQVTTSSLEALKQYSLGMESNIAMDFNTAAKYYENAIRLDSNFTAAKASLGNLLYQHFNKEEGRVWLQQAIKEIDHLTESERLSILAFYAANEEKDLDKCIQYTRMGLDLYPDRVASRNNLGYYLQVQGKYEESIREYKEAIRLDPHMMLPYAGMISDYMDHLGNLDSALVWISKMVDISPENGWGHFYLGSCYYGMDEIEKAEAEFEKAVDLLDGEILFKYRLAHTYSALGKYDRAANIFNEIITKDIGQSPAYYYLAVCYDRMNLADRAKELFIQYKSHTDYWEEMYPDLPATYLLKGAVLTRLGEKEEGFRYGLKGYQMDTSNHFEFARFLAVQGRTSEALDQLEMAFEQGYRQIVWIKMEPELDFLKDEPRYRQLLAQYFN